MYLDNPEHKKLIEDEAIKLAAERLNMNQAQVARVEADVSQSLGSRT